MTDPITRLNTALEGRYRIERELGEGGMATVYLAKDLKHNRDVALKALKPELAAVVGAERFLAEIETTANLQHPHILPLYDSGGADGLLFYVMPYVEGESLRDRLDRERQLAVDDAVRIATNLAEALDYAHARGVIHRDIKPANVLLQAGKPVISDFGIALAVSAGGGARLTETGLSLGTPHYMSPEQATGDQSVGPASDIYALGCVLYEMLVGEPPYTGSTAQAVLGKIVTGDADRVTSHRASVPGNVEGAVAKALEKVPADRFAGVGEMGRALGDPGFRWGQGAPVGAAAHGPSSTPWLGRALYGGGLVAVAVISWMAAGSRTPAPSPMQLSIAMAPEQELRPPNVLRVSSDGSMMVYTGPGDTDGDTRLWVRDWSSLEGTAIPGTAGVADFDVSPTNDEVAVLSGDSIRVQAIGSEAARTVAPGGAFCCVSWSDDGDWIYFTNADRGVSRVSPRGGDPDVLTTTGGGADHLWPHPVPGSDVVVFELYGLFGIDSRLAALDAASREYEEIGEGSYPTPAGDMILFTSGDGRELRYASFPPQPGGAATTIVRGLGWAGFGVGGLDFQRPQFDASATGDLVYVVGGAAPTLTGPRSQDIPGVPHWVTRDGTATPIDPTLTGVFRRLRIAPDGARLLLQGENEIYVKDLPDGPLATVTRDGTVNYRPTWMPDGSAVLYSSNRLGETAGEIEVFRVPPDGAVEPEAVGLESPSAMMTRDGEWWIYRTSNLAPPTFGDLMAVRIEGQSEPVPLVATAAQEAQPSVSRDGRWVAYSSDERGVRDVYVRPFPNANEGLVRITTEGGEAPAFSQATDELFVIEGGWMVALSYTTEPTFRVTGRERLFDASGYFVWDPTMSHLYDVTADGQRFAIVRAVDEGEASRQQIVLALGFLRKLGARVSGN